MKEKAEEETFLNLALRFGAYGREEIGLFSKEE